MKNTVLTFCLLLPLVACSNYKTPSISNSPRSMSADTLCYRYATAKKSADIAAEVAHRGLDCGAILSNDPLYRGGRY